MHIAIVLRTGLYTGDCAMFFYNSKQTNHNRETIIFITVARKCWARQVTFNVIRQLSHDRP